MPHPSTDEIPPASTPGSPEIVVIGPGYEGLPLARASRTVGRAIAGSTPSSWWISGCSISTKPWAFVNR